MGESNLSASNGQSAPSVNRRLEGAEGSGQHVVTISSLFSFGALAMGKRGGRPRREPCPGASSSMYIDLILSIAV